MKAAVEGVSSLSGRMYELYGSHGSVGIPFFSEFAPEICKVDPIELLVFQMRNYPHSYVLELFLSVPFVWRDFRTANWVDLMVQVGRRPQPVRCVDEMSEYCDIEFISKFLGLSALDVFVGISGVSDLDKSYAVRYFEIFADLLDPDGAQYLGLESGLLVGLDELRQVSERLLEEGVFVVQ